MFTDIVGYTALTQENESATMRLLEEHRKLIRPIFASHSGREIKTIGDAFLVEFESALDAILCAIAIQSAMNDRKLARGEKLTVRIGIHIGDVIEKEGDVLGDAVNIASRIYPLAEPGGICVSREVFSQVKNKVPHIMEKMAPVGLRNVSEPVEVFKVVMPWDKGQAAQSARLDSRRIAILPFANMSPDPNDEYLADGITDEIITTVSGIGGLKVISRTSVMGYKGTTKKLTEIGRELSVGSILEGSFKKAGSKIRVTTQLIDVAGDEHLWAKNYDRSLDDVFEVQSDVAKQVADALRVQILTPERERIEKKPTESTAAYTLYLKGRYHWNRRYFEDMKKATEYFEQAVKEDPGFALGYVGLADCFVLLRDNWGVDIVENLEKAKGMVAKALELGPELAEAHTTKAFVLYDECNLREAEEEYRKAIELRPSYATAHLWYSILLRTQQRWDEALEEIEKALELDPLSSIINVNHAFWFDAKGDYQREIEILKRVLELDPGYPLHHFMMWTYGRMEMLDDMRREASLAAKQVQGFESTTRLWADYCIAYYEGDKHALRALLPELEARANEPLVGASMVASCYFRLGENAKGFEWLEREYSQKRDSLLTIKVDHDFDGIRTDQRYLDLLKRLGLD